MGCAGTPPTDLAQDAAECLRHERNLLGHPDEIRPLADVPILLLPDAFCSGGDTGWRISLLNLLQEPWPGDAHFTQYTSDEDVRLRKDLRGTNLTFEVMGFDLDGIDHQPPSDAAWEELLRTTSRMKPQPNAVYRTRAGARLLYLVNPITAPLEFEQKRLRLMGVVEREKGETSPYVLDATKDWTRLLRAPRVLRKNRDGTVSDLLDMPVWVWHTNRLDMAGARWDTRAVVLPCKTTPGTSTGSGRVPRSVTPQMPPGVGEVLAKGWLATQLGAVSGKGGHDRTFSVCCRLLSRFDLDYDSALALLESWNERCDPPWSQRELEHKLTDAERRVRMENEDE